MAPGYTGKILHVNLTENSITIEEPDDKFYRQYMGGWSLVAYYLLKELPPGVEPLSPDNILVFATGVVTGTPIGGAGRSCVGAKSPLTGGFGEADVGGWWGTELNNAGWDAVVVKGKAESPVYLWIKDDQVEIRPADHLWGKVTAEVEADLKADLDDKRLRVAQIGLAGERMSRMAAVMHDINRAAGRTGLGAVMGSKNLKAIAVRGSGRKEIAEPKALNAVAKWLSDSYTETWLKGLRQDGTANGVYQHLIKGLPTKNFQQGTFEGGWEEITGTRMTETILIDRDNCYACPVHCKRVVEVEDDQHSVDPTYGGPEYETIGAFGSSCGVNDLKAIAKANELCNAYGLDTISAGVTIAWAMECYDRGLLTSADTGGIELNFGSADAMVQMVELIAKREGFGDLLAEGSYHAAQEIGRGTGQYVMHAKGQEVPMHEPRVKFALGVGYAVSPTGADHMHNIHDVEYDTAEKIAGMHPYGILEPLKYNDLSTEKMHLAATVIARSTLDNVLGFCMFVSGVFDPDHLVEMVRSITGWDTNLYELLRAGERGYIMARAFNAREGFTAADDKLPERFFQAYTEDPSEDNVLPQAEFDQARKDFYSILGWDHETAAPTEWKLRELGLGWVAEAIR